VTKCVSQLILNIESFAEAAGCAVKVFDLIKQVCLFVFFQDDFDEFRFCISGDKD